MVSDHYGAHYRRFADDVHASVRRAAFGDDVGQNSWLTREELDGFGAALRLAPGSLLVDVACGSGGPGLHLVRTTGCRLVGIELEEAAVAAGERAAREAGLRAAHARFVRADASLPLPLEPGSADAVLCVDAINHLPRRAEVLADWARLLRPGGRVLFTDPAVVTGLVSSDELALRGSIGPMVFAAAGEDERLLAGAGLCVVSVEDTTARQAEVARRRLEARAAHEVALREAEGDDGFEGRQRFFELVALLAGWRRLSRLAYLAERPADAPAPSARSAG